MLWCPAFPNHAINPLFILLHYYIFSLIAICCFAGVGFFLKGTFLPNNSIVLLSDIGVGSSALFCLTDRVACCSLDQTRPVRGLWNYPNSSNVVGASLIYRSRGSSSILLNRKSSATRPTGVFTCNIPNKADTSATFQMVFIGIYSHGDES